MQCLVVMAGSVAADNPAREQVWTHVLDPFIQDFQALLDLPDFTKNYQMDNYRRQVR